MGRPAKNTVDIHKLILKLAQSGMTNTAIAEVTGLARRTICSYLSDTDLGETVRTVRSAAIELDVDKKAAMNKAAIAAARRLLRKRKTKEIERRMNAAGEVYMTVEKEKELEPHAGIVEFVLKNTDAKNWNAAETGVSNNADDEGETDITINIVDEAAHDD
ncbi:MAG: hypothetical protein ACTTKL_11160 [Treponema sp.]